MLIYFVGVCGTAMGNAALLLKEQGHKVCGVDSGVYPPMSDVLVGSGIEIFDRFSAERLADLKPDQVVIGNAMSRGNVEVEWLLNQSKISYISLPQLFYDMILPGRKPVVIAGTHGKTTTSTLTAYLLEQSGIEPGWLIGGVPFDLPGGSRLGRGAPFVIEGDEYDSAFFDKRSKFIHYRPQVAVFGNLEFDHADIFRDLQDVKRTFSHFLRIIPSEGYALVNGDDENLNSLLPINWTQVVRVGTGLDNDLVIRNFTDEAAGSSFDLIWKGRLWARINWPMHGLFNARNAAMASLASAFVSGFEDPTEFFLSNLANFSGVKRRQDVLHCCEHWTVLEDFAHHPTAITVALEALRTVYPGRRIHACFEPRSNTATMSLFEKQFVGALALADSIYLGAVHRANSMKPQDRLDTEAIALMLCSRGRKAFAFEDNEQLLSELTSEIQSNDGGMIVFFTNGSFDGIQYKTADILQKCASARSAFKD